ncbi:MAG: hypothetical protein ISS48_01795 [Candidatus Aenigmarchaeota archaeon]|nr:hypothetical protein [Candidatus Aenigmarchaeota archaeon]
MINIKEEEIVLSLIKQECEESGSVVEDRILKMAQLLNINVENYEKVKTRLLETGKINKDGSELFLL